MDKHRSKENCYRYFSIQEDRPQKREGQKGNTIIIKGRVDRKTGQVLTCRYVHQKTNLIHNSRYPYLVFTALLSLCPVLLGIMGELNRGHNSEIPGSLVRTHCHNGTTAAALSVLIHMFTLHAHCGLHSYHRSGGPCCCGTVYNLFLGSSHFP